MDPAQEPAGRMEELPGREPADHEVAAGAVAGIAAGCAMGIAALLGTDQGSFFPLRLVAASFLGHEALDPISVGPVFLGAGLGALSAVVLALVFASILPRGLSPMASAAIGLVYGAVAWAFTWFVLVRLVDPVLFAAGRPGEVLLLNLLFGALLGLFLPPLRRLLP